MKRSKILILGDIHFPYHKQEALDAVLKAVSEMKEKPTAIVQIGDLYDQYGYSRYPKTMYVNPSGELAQARNLAIKMWKDLHKLAPRADLHQILGNHDIRIAKMVSGKCPEVYEDIKEVTEKKYTFDHVNTIHDYRELLEIDGVLFTHGYLSKSGDHMKYQNKSTVVGHSHVGGVVYQKVLGKVLWELNAGYLADEMSEPLYYRQTKTSKWTLGYGLIEDGQPRFVCL
jgi:predicted phosphodiesterase